MILQKLHVPGEVRDRVVDLVGNACGHGGQVLPTALLHDAGACRCEASIQPLRLPETRGEPRVLPPQAHEQSEEDTDQQRNDITGDNEDRRLPADPVVEQPDGPGCNEEGRHRENPDGRRSQPDQRDHVEEGRQQEGGLRRIEGQEEGVEEVHLRGDGGKGQEGVALVLVSRTGNEDCKTTGDKRLRTFNGHDGKKVGKDQKGKNPFRQAEERVNPEKRTVKTCAETLTRRDRHSGPRRAAHYDPSGDRTLEACSSAPDDSWQVDGPSARCCRPPAGTPAE